MTAENFSGMTVVAFESRLQTVMEEAIRKQGGKPIVAPSMQEIPLSRNPEVFLFGEKLLAGSIDAVVFLTGVGTRMMFEALQTRYAREKIKEALSRCTIIARGPKPLKVLKEYAIPVTILIPEPNTWREILEALQFRDEAEDFKGKTMAIQEYGESNERLMQGLARLGARLMRVPVYKWGLPDQLEPLRAAISSILERDAQLALFTSAEQARNVFRVAAQDGNEKVLREALRKIPVCSIGPVTSEALRALGLIVDFEPSRPKLGILVSEAAENADRLVAEKRAYPDLRFLSQNRKPVGQDNARTRQSVFLKACRREKTPYTPVWLMRQAGRYMKAYRQVRDQVSFLELCHNKELIAEVTIGAVERLGVDAAIIFSDILLILEPMGLGLEYVQGDGPVISGNLHTREDVDNLREVEPGESLNFSLESIRLTRACLSPDIPLIGFAGAPFTLAAYAIEGGGSKLFLKTKQFMYQDEGAWHALMEKISRALIKYLQLQVAAGADAIQLFDSWVGCLGSEDYRRYVLPHSKAVLASVQGQVPVIHFGTGTGPFLEDIASAGGDIIGVDFHTSLDHAWQRIGHDRGVQGNLDPAALYGPPAVIRQKVQQILIQAAGRPGHIFNLGHGILPTTPEDHAVALVDIVHEMSR